MDKKQFDAEKAIIDKHRAHLDRMMRDIEAELAEAEKPELRHGDYGWTPEGFPQIMVKLQSGGRIFAGSGFASDKKEFVDEEVLETPTGNIFDHLNAIAEDLTAFKTDVHWYRIESEDYPYAPIYMAGNHHTVAEVEEHILQLQRLVATYKRGQNEKTS